MPQRGRIRKHLLSADRSDLVSQFQRKQEAKVCYLLASVSPVHPHWRDTRRQSKDDRRVEKNRLDATIIEQAHNGINHRQQKERRQRPSGKDR